MQRVPDIIQGNNCTSESQLDSALEASNRDYRSFGNGAASREGGEFAAWMGIVPKQHSTVGKAKLYGISKRGNNCRRKILIHGAGAAVLRSKRERIAMGAWINRKGRAALASLPLEPWTDRRTKDLWTFLRCSMFNSRARTIRLREWLKSIQMCLY